VGKPCLPLQHTLSPRLDCRACARRMQPSFSSPFQAIFKVANVVFFVNADASCPAPAACRLFLKHHPQLRTCTKSCHTAREQSASLCRMAVKRASLYADINERRHVLVGWQKVEEAYVKGSHLFPLDVIWLIPGMSGT
jgi:hypothetical protein